MNSTASRRREIIRSKERLVGEKGEREVEVVSGREESLNAVSGWDGKCKLAGACARGGCQQQICSSLAPSPP